MEMACRMFLDDEASPAALAAAAYGRGCRFIGFPKIPFGGIRCERMRSLAVEMPHDSRRKLLLERQNGFEQVPQSFEPADRDFDSKKQIRRILSAQRDFQLLPSHRNRNEWLRGFRAQ